MISGGIVESHVKGFTKGSHEVGDEFGSTVGSNMVRNTVFREDMEDKESS